MRRRLPDLLILLLLAVPPLIMFWAQTVGGRTLLPTENLFQYEPYATYAEEVNAPPPHNRLLSDLVLENYQWKSFIRDSISQGEIPLWNPHQFSGIPFLAAGQHSALYPFSILYYVLPLPAAYGWFTVLQLWLAGAFMYLFMRGLGLGRLGGLISGVTYQMSAFFIISAVFPMIIASAAWLPLILLMAEFIIQQRPALRGRPSSLPWVTIGAAALGCCILAGHVEITYYTLLITAYYAAARLLWAWWTNRQTVGTRHASSIRYIFLRVLWLAAMVALGVGLGAIQFIPLFEFAGLNFRSGSASLSEVLGWAHPMRDVVQFLLPNFYGSPAHHSYFDIFTGTTIPATINALGQPIDTIDWGIKNYVEGALYLGILPLTLAAYALVDSWINRSRKAVQSDFPTEPPYRVIFALLSLVSLTFMFGLPTYAALYILPGISQLHSPFRWIFAVTLGVAALAGFGGDALVTARQSWPKWARRFGWVLAGAGVVILGGLLLSRLLYPQVEPLVDRVLGSMALATNAFADARMFYSYQFTNILVLGLMTLGAGAVFLWASRSPAVPVGAGVIPSRPPIWQLLAVGLVAVDLMIASWGFNPASDPALLDFTPPAIEWLLQRQAEVGPFRYTTLEDSSLGERGKFMNANIGMRYGLDDVRGYDSIIPKQYVDYMQGVSPQVQLDFNRVAPIYADQDYAVTLNSPALALLNVHYVVAPRSLDMDVDGWTLAYEDASARIWEQDAASFLPRAYTVPSEGFDTAALTVPAAYTTAEIIQDTGREQLVNIQTQEPSWLIVSQTYLPGWRAFIRPQGAGDDAEQPAEVQLVQGNFQGVQLPEAGDWTVRVVYSPVSFQLGLFASFISGILLVFMGGVYLWRLYIVRENQSGGVQVVARNSLAPIILSLFNRGIDFGFAFIMLRILGPEEAGIYTYAAFIFGWFDIFTNFGLNVFLTREVSQNRAQAWRLLYNTSVLRVLLMVIGVFLLAGFLGVRQGTGETPLAAQAVIAIGLLYVGLIPNSLSTGLSALFYAFEQAEVPAAITTLATICKATFGVAALALGYGVIGLAAVSIITNCVTLAVMAWQARGLTVPTTGAYTDAPLQTVTKRGWRPEWGLIHKMVGESWPLMLNHFLATIFFQIDVVIIQAIHGDKMVGQYGVAYKWVAALNVIPAFFTMALLPVMSRQAREDKESLRRTYILAIKLLVSVALPLSVIFTALAYPLTFILAGNEFLPDGAIATQFMIWSIPIGWINSLTQYVLIALNLQKRITWAFIGAVSFNIVGNTLFIPQYGYQAAAVITILSETVLLIPFGLLLMGAIGRLPWVQMLWRPVVSAAVMIAILLLGWSIQPALAFVAAVVGYVVLLLILRPLDTAELERLSPLLPGKLRRMLKLSPPAEPVPMA